MGSFYDNDSGDDVMFNDTSDETHPADRREPEVVDLSGEEAEDGAPKEVASRKVKTSSSSSSSSRFHTLSEFEKQAAADSDSGEEGERFYAGGSDHGRYSHLTGRMLNPIATFSHSLTLTP